MRDRTRILVALVLSALALGLAACGDDEEEPAGSATTERTDTSTADTTATETEPTTETTGDDAGDGRGESGGMTAPPEDRPEEQDGGAGDEVPASSQALITGSGGKLSPRTVQVPPFIAVSVELVSDDGVEYELAANGQTIEAGGEIRSASSVFEGLRPGERLVLTGPQGKVTVVANAEPGP